ncbi:accessory Sec system protein Asp2 [Limosilactobacillus sp.]|uniref:accessory Sec system protein Asp2 n=1 Tax=Limosilactobacillus sp. TaxID=2773925 RepID=UPI00345E20ED
MRILQLGSTNWADQYQLPKDMDWEFNVFPNPDMQKAKKGFDAVIIAGPVTWSSKKWNQLLRKVDPYHVIYLPAAMQKLDKAGQLFIQCSNATEITEDPQTVIDHLPTRLFFGQSGIRFMPSSFQPLMDRIESFQMMDQSHIKMEIDTDGQWVNIGNFRDNIFIDPGKLMSLWLEMESDGLEARLRVFIQPSGGDGDVKDCYLVSIGSNLDNPPLPISAADYPRYASVSLEVKGSGDFTLGILHSRWSREGYGDFIAGGKRIVNPANHEDIAYFFSNGDLRPPLNVYFSGARSAEGFEAFPLFHNLHAPMLLFTDMRQEAGQFYTTSYMEEHIKSVIDQCLKQLGFNRSQLVMNGISMGTYPALKLGVQMQVGFINVAKQISNLGYVSRRARLQRPGAFETSYDIDNRLVKQLDDKNLQKLDNDYWELFNKQDLSNTRLFVAYMENDDYDDHAIKHLRESAAIAKAKQFVYRGFPGRHNDNRQINYWFMRRLQQILRQDFSREL